MSTFLIGTVFQSKHDTSLWGKPRLYVRLPANNHEGRMKLENNHFFQCPMKCVQTRIANWF